MVLKPQDVVVALKLSGFSGKRPAFARIAMELCMSPSEVHAAVKRGQEAHLVHGPELGEKANVAALEEFLIHGLKYAFPAKRGGVTRGFPTSYAAEPLVRHIDQGDELPPVWPSAEGTTKGVALEPLYPTVPEAAKRDPQLYELLALVDALRDGRVRERKIAEKELVRRLRGSARVEPKS
jgi:hypothetical protein